MTTIEFEDLGIIESTPQTKETMSKFSAYLITLNSNKVSSDAHSDKQLDACLKNALKECLSRDNFEKYLIKLKPGPIDHIFIRVQGEVGHHPKGKRVHVHAVVEIEHHSKIHLNYKTFMECLRSSYKKLCPGAKNPYINIQRVTSQKMLEQYLTKGGLDKKKA